MEPDSKRLMVWPSLKVSVMAGMRPLGLIARNQGSFCVNLLMSTSVTSYGMPSSSRVMETLMPFGVCIVYRWMLGRFAAMVICDVTAVNLEFIDVWKRVDVRQSIE